MFQSSVGGSLIRRRRPSIAAVAGAAGVLATLVELPAAAQDRLGDGRGLERRLSITAPTDRGDRNREFFRDLQFRNAIVTGNAPNGLSFRGDIGYSAEGNFFAPLGSNDLFAFRRDTISSGLSGRGVRGTDALQFQFGLTTGLDAPRLISGGLPVSRGGVVANAGGRVSARGLTTSPAVPDRPPAFGEVALERRRSAEFDQGLARSLGPGADAGLLGTLRSPSAYTASRSFRPLMSGVTTQTTAGASRGGRSGGVGTSGDPLGLTASPLLGVRRTPVRTERSAAEARLAEPASPLAGGGPIDRPLDTRIDPTASTASSRPSPSANGASIRDRALVELEANARRRAEPTDDPDRPTWVQRLEDLDALFDEADAIRAEQPTPPADLGADERGETAASRLGRLLRDTPVRIERLAPTVIVRGAEPAGPDAGDRVAFAALMDGAQELMRDGRYFDAEERFARALAVDPNDVGAQLGRVHAQAAAGLVRSASANLTPLLVSRAEIGAITLTPEALAAPERLREVGEVVLLPRVEEGRAGFGEAALLAYLGRQLGERPMIEAGVAHMLSVGEGSDVVLTRVLQSAWLGGAAGGSDAGSGGSAGRTSGGGGDEP